MELLKPWPKKTFQSTAKLRNFKCFFVLKKIRSLPTSKQLNSMKISQKNVIHLKINMNRHQIICLKLKKDAKQLKTFAFNYFNTSKQET